MTPLKTFSDFFQKIAILVTFKGLALLDLQSKLKKNTVKLKLKKF